ncbi:MAG: Xaa-Pro dipeptidase [Cyanobacteria bacterium RYN_339]|nr:Xaa-Pro dipeptidase [Cyanobacteria bacterium RYN_339]
MPKGNRLKSRLHEIRREMARLGLPALLVTDAANVAYLTGFQGTSACVVMTADRAALIVDIRYYEQATRQAPQTERVLVQGALYDEALVNTLQDLGATRLAFEADALPVARHMAVSWRLPKLELVPTRGIVERAREVKDADELVLVRAAADITSGAILRALEVMSVGMSERAVASLVEAEFWRLGADGPAFPTLVASGPRSALPHPRPGDRLIEAGDLVLIDAGAVVEGYRADMSRTVVVGPPTRKQRAVWDAVHAALEAGLARVRPGVAASAVDAACRKALQARGFAAVHDTGHGVGLDLHEGPRVAGDSEDVLAPGMVITVEPGVYEAGWGGVRLEQLVLVTPAGPEVLTTAPLAIASPCGSVRAGL